jgi:5-methylthioadenosine/S-adenosylhomocysteine deaminase
MTGERTLLRGGRVLRHSRAELAEADLLVEGGRIAAIEPWGRIDPEVAREIDASDRILIPGLLNAHMHGHGNLSKGAGDRWTLELLLNAGPWASRLGDDLDAIYLAASVGAVEMLLKGCTACYDLFVAFPTPTLEGLEAVGRAYADAGMRAVVAPMMADRTFYAAIPGLTEALPDALRDQVLRMASASGEAHLEACAAALKAWPFDRDRIRPALAPTIPLHCADEFMVGAARLAREHDIGYHTHLGESKVQAVSGLERYGVSLTRHLDRLGVLGPNFTAAHAVWLDADDIARMAGHGAAVAHNPGSNMRLGSGIAPARRMLTAGVHLGIGTDGASCSDNLNMFEAMRLASLASHVRGPDYEAWLSTREVFELATEGSAHVLGFAGDLGRLEVGYHADVVFLDAMHINFTPLNNAINQLVHTEDGSAVDKVMVGGKLVVDGGEILTVDRRVLKHRAEATAERLRRSHAALREVADRLEPIVGAFCRGIATKPYHIHNYGGPRELD